MSYRDRGQSARWHSRQRPTRLFAAWKPFWVYALQKPPLPSPTAYLDELVLS